MTSLINTHTTETIGQDETLKFSSSEIAAGVGVNRLLMVKQDSTEPEVYFSDMGGTAINISIEKDPTLADFLFTTYMEVSNSLRGVDNPTSLDVAQAATNAVVTLTPNVDTDNSYHQQSTGTSLGEALTRPVQCVERALAMEAALKMEGVVTHAGVLPVRIYTEKSRILHVDTVFNIKDGGTYVALSTGITAGRSPGEIVGIDEYLAEMNALTDQKGISNVVVDVDAAVEYFQEAVN